MALSSHLLRTLLAGVALAAASVVHAQGSPQAQASVRLPSAAAIAARTAGAPDVWEDEVRRAPAPASTYRTLCVRLCDGFYFPVSFQTSRQGLETDAARCQAKCGSGAQLFFYANPGGNVASARSFTGLVYEALPNAFRHLKTRVPNCGCTPDPWSTAEQERHRAYAEKERAEVEAAATATAQPSQAPPPAQHVEHARPLPRDLAHN